MLIEQSQSAVPPPPPPRLAKHSAPLPAAGCRRFTPCTCLGFFFFASLSRRQRQLRKLIQNKEISQLVCVWKLQSGRDRQRCQRNVERLPEQSKLRRDYGYFSPFPFFLCEFQEETSHKASPEILHLFSDSALALAPFSRFTKDSATCYFFVCPFKFSSIFF